MVDDVEIKETSEITQGSLESLGSEVGNNLGVIREKHSITADALWLHARLYNDQMLDDPRALLIKEIVREYQDGVEQSAINKITHVFEGERYTKPEDLQVGLTEFRNLTSSAHSDDLYKKVQSQMEIVRKKLVSDDLRTQYDKPIRVAMRNPDDYKGETRQLLEAYQKFDLASKELTPNLTATPSKP